MGNKSYSKGISWINDCRIPTTETETLGRFPANLLVSDDMLNDGVITKQNPRKYKPTDNNASFFGNLAQAYGEGIGDSGSSSRYYDIDKWFDNLIND